MPALQTRLRTNHPRAGARATALRAVSGLATSPTHGATAPPAAWISVAIASRSSAVRPTTMTGPILARRRAMAQPIPRPPPVTIEQAVAGSTVFAGIGATSGGGYGEAGGLACA